MHMIMNNLDPSVAQFPHELVTYGGNGQVFSNWAQVSLSVVSNWAQVSLKVPSNWAQVSLNLEWHCNCKDLSNSRKPKNNPAQFLRTLTGLM